MKLLQLIEQLQGKAREEKLLLLFAKRLFGTKFRLFYSWYQYDEYLGEDSGEVELNESPLGLRFARSTSRLDDYFDVHIFIKGPDAPTDGMEEDESFKKAEKRVVAIGEQYGLKIAEVRFEYNIPMDVHMDVHMKRPVIKKGLYIKPDGKTFGSLD